MKGKISILTFFCILLKIITVVFFLISLTEKYEGGTLFATTRTRFGEHKTHRSGPVRNHFEACMKEMTEPSNI